MPKQKIVLHIGHGKTGSSAIQTALARHRETLWQKGMLYPLHAAIEEARSGRVTSGNLNHDHWFEGQVIPAVREHPDCPTFVFSNENLFDRMDEFFDTYERHAADYDVEIILFVREPIEMLASSYQQAIKRSGFTGNIGELVPLMNHAAKAAALVDRLEQCGVGVRLFNYSAVRRHAVERLFTHLGLWDAIDDEDAGSEIVNRSLTLAELRFVRDLNKVFGAQYGAIISDALVHHLPDLMAGRPAIDAAIEQAVHDRQLDAIHSLNRRLPGDEQLSTTWVATNHIATGDQELSSEQAEVIRRAFPGALIHADGPILRDIAMKYESGEPLDRKDGITLMEYAHKARPHGKIIAGKLAEWRR